MGVGVNPVEFSALELVQPIGKFYIGVIPAKDVVDIAYADVRQIEDRDIERYVGIQRKLNARRVKELRKYVTHVDATFPACIILAVEPENVEYSSKSGLMRIARNDSVAQIIDGQHRIAGLYDFEDRFDLPVTIFVDMDLQDRAMTFATINLQQTKVSKSLVYDLYAFQKQRSPVKTAHQIARLLNQSEKSPLYQRLKILGVASEPDQNFQNITQAAFVESLVVYISAEKDDDRDALRRGHQLPEVPESKKSKLMFRQMFENGQDAKIARVVSNLFDAVADRWPDAWESQERGDILNKTTGFKAVMRYLGPLYRKHGSSNSLPLSAIKDVLKKVKLKDSDFNRDRFKPGGSGESELFSKLRDDSGL